jgi:hypothetical protein
MTTEIVFGLIFVLFWVLVGVSYVWDTWNENQYFKIPPEEFEQKYNLLKELYETKLREKNDYVVNFTEMPLREKVEYEVKLEDMHYELQKIEDRMKKAFQEYKREIRREIAKSESKNAD